MKDWQYTTKTMSHQSQGGMNNQFALSNYCIYMWNKSNIIMPQCYKIIYYPLSPAIALPLFSHIRTNYSQKSLYVNRNWVSPTINIEKMVWSSKYGSKHFINSMYNLFPKNWVQITNKRQTITVSLLCISAGEYNIHNKMLHKNRL